VIISLSGFPIPQISVFGSQGDFFDHARDGEILPLGQFIKDCGPDKGQADGDPWYQDYVVVVSSLSKIDSSATDLDRYSKNGKGPESFLGWTKSVSIGLCSDFSKDLFFSKDPGARTQGLGKVSKSPLEKVLPVLIQQVLGWMPKKSIRRIVTFEGPGPFTTLRIAKIFAQSLSFLNPRIALESASFFKVLDFSYQGRFSGLWITLVDSGSGFWSLVHGGEDLLDPLWVLYKDLEVFLDKTLQEKAPDGRFEHTDQCSASPQKKVPIIYIGQNQKYMTQWGNDLEEHFTFLLGQYIQSPR
jgi:hypothetical protein